MGKKLLCGLGLLCLAVALHAQKQQQHWFEVRHQPGATFTDVQQAFQKEWGSKEQDMLRERRQRKSRKGDDAEEEAGGYFMYKRWEWFYAPRVYPSGDLSLPSTSGERFQQYLNTNTQAHAQQNGAAMRINNSSAQISNWSFVGPTGAPGGGGAGRVNAVRCMPGNNNILFACTPAGGLWKSTNNGGSWTNLTDFLSVIGAADVVIDPTNTNTMYLATGDGDAGDTYSIGVLKSTDGGITWNNTGLTWNVSQQRQLSKLLIDPTNPNIIYAGGTAGIWKTINGGASWSQATGNGVKDMEFKPGHPNTIYACGTKFYRSTNSGANWSIISTGLPVSSTLSRMAIGVTAADTNYVYVLAGVASSYGFAGLFLSANSGTSFIQQSSSPNVLGWDPNGNDTDGQAWYDLSIAVSQTNKDHLVTGGVNIWESIDAGQSWSLNAHWYGGGGAPYVHADIHALDFKPNSNTDILAGCDGGVFGTTNSGNSWNDLSSNLCIAQIYRMGLSASDATELITGHQDNGTNLKVNTTYDEVIGGDGMDCFIDWNNNNVMYGELYYGDFNRSTNGGASFQGITNGLNGSAAWVTPWAQDPQVANTLYAGYEQVFKSTNQGNSWSQLGTLSGGGELVDVEAAPSNNQYLYAARNGQVFRTNDGGTTWVNVTLGIPVSSGQITMLAIAPYDPQTCYVTLSGYSAGDKVFVTHNAGANWSNISNGLPNLPANAVCCVPGSGSDAVYVGMDVGVYYRDNNTGGWVPYFTGLPNVPVFDLHIFKPTMTLRAATFGRGVWETAVDVSVLAPLAQFTASSTVVCPGTQIQFTDQSTNSPTSWNWSFPGGTPSTSTQQNPQVTYANPGVYAVTLIAANANGSDAEQRTAYITVTGAQAPLIEGFTSSTFLPSGWTAVNVANQNAYWQRSSTTGHNSTDAAYFNNLNNNVNGAQDEMHTESINTTNYGTLTLGFDVAYARYNTSRTDTLEVLISTDCGTTWTSIYLKGGSTLATVPNQTSAFTPTNSQWRVESVNLNTYAGQSSLLFSFRNRGHNGNYLWLDNINIAGTANAAPIAAFSTSPACENTLINLQDQSAGAPTSWSWDLTGGTPSTSTSQNPQVTYPAGTYTITLITGNSFGNDTVSQQITVPGSPVANAGTDASVCSGGYVQLQATGGGTYSWSNISQLNNAYIANPVAHPTTSINDFVVTVTDSNGCSDNDTVHVSLMALPTLSIAGPGAICPGDTVQLIASGNGITSYDWQPSAFVTPTNNDSVLVFPAASTTYTITIVDTNGCSNIVNRYVSLYPPVATPTISVNGNVLTSSLAAAYQWYLNGVLIPGATSQSYTAIAQGFYTVVVFAGTGCSSSASASVLISVHDPLPPVTAFDIYPNPNDGHFQVSFTADKRDDYSVAIEDVLGRVVYSETLDRFRGDYKHTFDLTAEGNGVYMIIVRDAQQQSVRQLIVH